MARVVPGIVALNAGEVSPVLHGRTDLAKYAASMRTCENMLPLSQGPLVRRPGSKFVQATKSNGVARLVPFEFSTVQAYTLEFGNLYIRFYRNGAPIETSPGVPYEIVSPYTLAQVATLQWAQSADTLYIACPNVRPYKLTRTGHTAWTITAISFTATPASWTGANFPATVTFFQQRLWWAATPNEPQTLWASKTVDYENLTVGAAADDALTFTLADEQMNAIKWLRAQRVLLIGTAGGEFSLSGGTNGAAVTPTSVQAQRQSTVGCGDVPAVTVGTAVIYVQRFRRKIYELAFSFDVDGYVSPELSLLAGHIGRARIKEMAWAQEPWRVMWFVLDDGQLVGMTYMRDQQVVAWHRHPMGGRDVKVLSVAVIPGTVAAEVWLIVERTIDGGTKRYVEKMDGEFWEGDADVQQDDAFFVDSGITYSGPPATALSGAAHLVGETVQILGDGAVQPDVVVGGGGTLALARAASVVHAGFSYRSVGETLDINAGVQDGTAITRKRRVHEVGVLLFQTLGCKVGYADAAGVYQLDEIQFRFGSSLMDAPPPLFTGVKKVLFPPNWDRECRVAVVQDQPLPMTVVALAPRITAHD